VDFDFDFDPDKDREFDETISTAEEKKWDGHRPKSIKFLNFFEKKYGLSRNGMTSWTTTSMTGFVTEAQIEKIARDKRTTLITENAYQTFSANDVITSGESSSWGWSHTTNNTVLNAGVSERRVYVIDSGVAAHDDLNVIYRTNVACGTGVQNCSTSLPNDVHSVVGCYPHATHVAGIIGAIGGNGKTSVGVYAGVKIISVSVVGSTNSSTYGKCALSSNGQIVIQSDGMAPPGPYISSIGYALDWIRKSTLIRASLGDTRVPIVNMSINGGQIGFNSLGQAETNNAKLLNMVAPALNVRAPNGTWDSKVCAKVNYPGAFFVQSAGNQNTGAGKDVCSAFANGNSLAYKPSASATTSSTSDGIMVVGAINNSGYAVDSTPVSTRVFSAPVPAGSAGTPTASNYGKCVDVWAPGNSIYSTWCSHPQSCIVGQTYTGNGNNSAAVTQGWAYLSGTSIAAPHVAGAAAYLADSLTLASPAAIETAIRARLFPTISPTKDQGNNDVKWVQVP
jgi:hypothetical protein